MTYWITLRDGIILTLPFDLSKGFCKPEDIVNLKDHHRSHAQIIGFSNKEFYQENLRIATNYKLLKVLDDKTCR